MLGWLRQLCRDRRGVAALEYGLLGLLIIVVVISSMQLLTTSDSQDLASPDRLFSASPAGS
ncbi:MAG TPA: hypothetical protein VNR89_06950 [Roseomonas sp.]|nr:hypothetical protein [Roseomonas sp.]